MASDPDGSPSLALPFPDLDLPDHTGRARRLSEVAGGDPVALFFSRGWWCPKEQRYLRGLVALQDEFEVAYARIVVAGPGGLPGRPGRPVPVPVGRRAALAPASRPRRAHTDTVHDPYAPSAYTLHPDLQIHAAYNGYWYWGRPTAEELRQDMRAISTATRPEWTPPAVPA
jgi:hypothetical protein